MSVTRKVLDAVITMDLLEESRVTRAFGLKGDWDGEVVDQTIGGDLPGIDRWTSWGLYPQIVQTI